MKYQRAFAATVIYMALLVCFYVIHVNFIRVDVVLYGALFDVMLATVVAAVLLFGWRYFGVINYFEKAQLIAIWLLAGYACAISGPTVLDRSLSFYILEKLDQRGGGIQRAKFEDVFTKEFAKEHRLVDARLTEQLASGTIYIADGCVRLTERGAKLAQFSRFFRRNLLPKHRLLMGEYSDVLTDPFRQSELTVDYEC